MRPEVGLELANPVAATRTVFTATAESTDGAYVEIEMTYPPHSPPPPCHFHPAQEEHFTVLSGRMHVRRGDEEMVVTTGDEFSVPAGTTHQLWADEQGATLRWRTSPALQTGEMFCALWEVARDHEWKPGPLDLYGVITRFGDEFQLCP